jgi:hypothetical protein
VVESDGLENRCSGNATVGSNPTLSAGNKIKISLIITTKAMKAKYLLIITISLLLLLGFSAKSHAQDEMDFEAFMGMMSHTFTDSQLDEISYQLPWDIKVCSYAYGDFSNDGTTDIVISVIEKGVTPPNTVDVYVLKSVDDQTWVIVDKSSYEYFELTLEVAFLVENGECYITHRDTDNWYFTGYKINENHHLEQIDEEFYPIDFGKAGN